MKRRPKKSPNDQNHQIMSAAIGACAAVFGGAAILFADVFKSSASSNTSREIARMEATNQKELAHISLEHELITSALKLVSPEQAVKVLEFYIEIGAIRTDDVKSNLQRYINNRESSDVPMLTIKTDEAIKVKIHKRNVAFLGSKSNKEAVVTAYVRDAISERRSATFVLARCRKNTQSCKYVGSVFCPAPLSRGPSSCVGSVGHGTALPGETTLTSRRITFEYNEDIESGEYHQVLKYEH